MIVKSMSRRTKSFKQLLMYLLNDKDKLTDKDGTSFILKQHINGETIIDWEKAFLANEAGRMYHRANNVFLYHELISWSSKDVQQMNSKKMLDMAQAYLRLRSENALAIAVPHQSKDHYHVHFCISAVELETGLSARISRQTFKQIKLELQAYQKTYYPELTNSIVAHGKKERRTKSVQEYELTKRSGIPSKKEILQQTIQDCYRSSTSTQQFISALAQKGIPIYERKGIPTGVVMDRKFRFSTLGLDKDKIANLDKIAENHQSISDFRQNIEQQYSLEKDTDSLSREDELTTVQDETEDMGLNDEEQDSSTIDDNTDTTYNYE